MGDLTKKAKNLKSRPEAKPQAKSQAKPQTNSQAKGSDTAGPNKTGPSNLHNVYDKYYKTIFSYSTLLEEFFQVFFPQLAKHVDFKKCQQLKSTFIQPDYVEREADMVYSVPIAGKSVYIYILIEHQSKPDKQIFLRLIGYQLALWNDLIKHNKANPLKLPPILPMVFYNGKSKWEIPKRFTKTFAKAPKEIMKFTPNFEYLFFDIHSTSDAILSRGDELIKLPLLLDKNRDQVDQYTKTFFPLIFEKLRSKSESARNEKILFDLLKTAYHFILYHTKLPREQLELDLDSLEIAEEFRREFIQMRKSAAHQLYEEGRLEGKLEGKLEGIQEGKLEGIQEGIEKGQDIAKMELARNLLAENTEVAFVARITGLDTNVILAMKRDLKK